MFRFGIMAAGIVTACLTAAVSAQTPPTAKPAPAVDQRLAAALKAAQLNYTVDPSGDLLVNLTLPENRKQYVLIKSATVKVGDLEVRQIRSCVQQFSGELQAGPANNLLRMNRDARMAVFQIHGDEKGQGPQYIMLVARVDATLEAEKLRDVILLVGKAADSYEKQWTGKDVW
jgi:hypothetical protein